jgi:hypothetical protein
MALACRTNWKIKKSTRFSDSLGTQTQMGGSYSNVGCGEEPCKSPCCTLKCYPTGASM